MLCVRVSKINTTLFVLRQHLSILLNIKFGGFEKKTFFECIFPDSLKT